MAKSPDIHHSLAVDRTLGALHLRVDLSIWAPWTLLFGPSGSGKSSILRAACGLLGGTGVRFSKHGPTGKETSLIAAERSVPAHLLGLGYAPQGGVLFPHLSVQDNISFALSVRGAKLPDAQMSTLFDMFEITHLRTRLPALLSGGERQRVSLARAFAVPNSHLLLLDEPFSGMGRDLRNRLLTRMRQWTDEQKVPVLSVTHDVEEALLANADVIVLENGKVVRQGQAAQALATEQQEMLQILQR